jgi:hypothetical protein
MPANQAKEGLGYFSLVLAPKEVQTIQVAVLNTTDEPIKVNIALAQATTNVNGVVEYSPNTIQPDETLKYDITKLASFPKQVVLSARETKTIDIIIRMPEEKFDGVIAGGLTFKQQIDQSKQTQNSESFSVNNEYQYVIALLMQQNKNPITANLKLNEVKASQLNYRNVIFANLQNINMAYLQDMQINAVVKGIDNPDLLFQTTKENMKMAPNTNFDFPIPIGDGQSFEAGKYQLNMSIFGDKSETGQYQDEKGQKFNSKWTFEREFTITSRKASELNHQDVTVVNNQPSVSWVLWFSLGILLIAVVVLVIVLVRMKNKFKSS